MAKKEAMEEAKKAKKEAESEAAVMKAPVQEDEDGKLIKAEEESEEEEEVEKEAEAEDEEDEEENEDEVKKGELGGENPAELVAQANTAEGSISPNAGVPSTQHIMYNNSHIQSARNATSGSHAGGQSPSDVSFSGKSANTDLNKSPLYVELSKQIGSFEKAVAKKIESIEKSMADRLANLQKTIAAVEEFYNKSLNKAYADTSVDTAQVQSAPTTLKALGEAGKISYR